MVNFTQLLLNKSGVSDRLHRNRLRCIAVWNITRACNLACRHCYISARPSSSSKELSENEARKVIDGLLEIGTGVVLFSGGEPLLRKDIFSLIRYASSKGLRCALSSNGTLITKDMAKRLKDCGIIYIGISIDGNKNVHNRFRGKNCFELALSGLRYSRDTGIPVGVRFTINRENYRTLPEVLAMVVEERIPRFCMYHLVYTGRAVKELDISNRVRRRMVDYLIRQTQMFADKDLEILTVDNPCDGIYLYKHIVERFPYRRQGILEELVSGHGRCSAGERILSISPEGEVFACQFWSYRSLGNIRERNIMDVWKDSFSPYIHKLRHKNKYLRGKCGVCLYKEFCGGCRLRAKAVYNNLWGEDPSCYLSKKEVTNGVSGGKDAAVEEE